MDALLLLALGAGGDGHVALEARERIFGAHTAVVRMDGTLGVQAAGTLSLRGNDAALSLRLGRAWFEEELKHERGTRAQYMAGLRVEVQLRALLTAELVHYSNGKSTFGEPHNANPGHDTIMFGTGWRF